MLCPQSKNPSPLGATSEGRKLAAVFTSEDSLAALLPELRQAAAPEQVVERIFAGAALFQILQSMPIEGIVFNCKGPVEPIAFAKAFADVVCETQSWEIGALQERLE